MTRLRVDLVDAKLMLESGCTYQKVADKYGTSRQRIHQLLPNRTIVCPRIRCAVCARTATNAGLCDEHFIRLNKKGAPTPNKDNKYISCFCGEKITWNDMCNRHSRMSRYHFVPGVKEKHNKAQMAWNNKQISTGVPIGHKQARPSVAKMIAEGMLDTATDR